MKVKVKFDLAAIKRGLIEHGEKVALAGVMLVFVLFTYSAARREVLDDNSQPDKLKQKAVETTGHVSQSKFDAKRESVAIVDYEQRAKRDKVLPESYAVANPWDKPLVDLKVQRDDPKILPLEEPRVAGGFGTFAMRGAKGNNKGGSTSGGGYKPTADSKLQAQAWAVVTALVPIQTQTQEYMRVFDRADGADKNRDRPHYEGYELERAEVDEAHPDKLDWKPVDLDKIAEIQSQWENLMADIVSEEYIEPALTMSLGPLVYVDWNESVAHPKIPLADAANRSQVAMTAAAKGDNAAPTAPVGRKQRFGVPHRPADQPDVSAAAAPEPLPPSTLGYRLLRVFDFTVVPTKKYRYRVKVGLANPNYQVHQKFLQNPDSKAGEFVDTGWSEPTGVVAIPNGYRVLASTAPKKGFSSIDPTTKIMLTAIDKKEGIEAPYEMDVSRGAVANAVRTVQARDPRDGKWREMVDVDFKTGIVVLDYRGARSISKKDKELIASVEVLVVDPQGNLSVHNELDDQRTVENFRPPEDDSKPSKSDLLRGDDAKSKPKPKKTTTSANR